MRTRGRMARVDTRNQMLLPLKRLKRTSSGRSRRRSGPMPRDSNYQLKTLPRWPVPEADAPAECWWCPYGGPGTRARPQKLPVPEGSCGRRSGGRPRGWGKDRSKVLRHLRGCKVLAARRFWTSFPPRMWGRWSQPQLRKTRRARRRSGDSGSGTKGKRSGGRRLRSWAEGKGEATRGLIDAGQRESPWSGYAINDKIK